MTGIFYLGRGFYRDKPTSRVQETADNRYYKKRYIEKTRERTKQLLNKRDWDL